MKPASCASSPNWNDEPSRERRTSSCSTRCCRRPDDLGVADAAVLDHLDQLLRAVFTHRDCRKTQEKPGRAGVLRGSRHRSSACQARARMVRYKPIIWSAVLSQLNGRRAPSRVRPASRAALVGQNSADMPGQRVDVFRIGGQRRVRRSPRRANQPASRRRACRRPSPPAAASRSLHTATETAAHRRRCRAPADPRPATLPSSTICEQPRPAAPRPPSPSGQRRDRRARHRRRCRRCRSR